MPATKSQEAGWTTAAAARLVGYSTQQVRDLERLGVLPAAERTPNGYRRYQERHILALRAYRALATAIGPVPARQMMPTLVQGTLDAAAEKIDDLHALLARSRDHIREASRGLQAVLTDTTHVFDDHDSMTISELAEALGVRASALRHWEHEGLVNPDRVSRSQTRRYNARAITEARIVAALRSGGHRIPPIARVLDQLRQHGLTAEAQALLDERLTVLSRRSVVLLGASGDLHALLNERAQTAAAG
ncbi:MULTISPECIES: MerR family transcriptional regulator [Microbacterium]|uniref:MerR family transcriptional regulator n=1 Tax=Microbacterium wangchenii TaxID=2541726 RepID=A0ABX5SWA8_9MICO|nr:MULTISPECIES: MerR family transcriptional regulator [Microbacterium]MCK6066212.1 MerR family transcriptional regulator [Microbacterium sp. EYE_512]QBR90483.1 MerR family transcriptional regulator [Microbacterium wangchenii]TFV84709.1 MerR family transcriptional regulator [Microbacterium sp. dk485]TXK14509.1 MerR family transcriptional regulator [Microbacterium wangchenii]